MQLNVGSGLLATAAVAALCVMGMPTGATPARIVGQADQSQQPKKGGGLVFTPVEPIGRITMAKSVSKGIGYAKAGDVLLPVGDEFEVAAGGILRMSIGTSSRVTVGSDSRVELHQEGNATRLIVMEGRVTFGSSQANPLLIQTPIATMYGTPGSDISGDVALTGPKSIRIVDRKGEFVVEKDGNIKPLTEGKTYSVTVESATPSGAAAAETSDSHKERLVFKVIPNTPESRPKNE